MSWKAVFIILFIMVVVLGTYMKYFERDTLLENRNLGNFDATKTANETDLPNHGIMEFDWDGWVKDHNFVDIGSIWGYCDDKDPIVVGKILLFDEGGSLSVTAVFNTTFDSDIHGGSAEGRVKYYDTEMYHKTYDICELAEKYEDDFFICPIPAGEKFFLKEKAVSRFIPTGVYTIELTMKNETGRVLLCASFKMMI